MKSDYGYFSVPNLTQPEYGVYLEVVDYDRLHELNSHESFLLNDFNMKDDEQRERLNRLLITEYSNDTIDVVPTCECGDLRREINIGVICTTCNTRCIRPTERPMRSILWAKVPDGVLGYISPGVWNIFMEYFTVGKNSIIRWLVDPVYVAPDQNIIRNHQFFVGLRENLKWKRSINEFISRFDEVMDYIFNYKPKVVSNADRELLLAFIAENKHKFFPRYLPIPNKALFISEKSQYGVKLDKTIHAAIDGARTVSSMSNEIVETSLAVRENKTVKVITQFAEFYAEYDADNLSKKPGIFRHQIYGARLDNSGRAVITSIYGKHSKDEIHFPWMLAVNIFKNDLVSVLQARGYSPVEHEEIINKAVTTFDPLIDEIFDKLIADRGGYIPVVFQRNPTLTHGSAQQLKMTYVKKDLRDPTISLSVLVLAQYNADFDGDEMNARVNIDKREELACSRLKPDLNVMSTNQPGKVTSAVNIPGPTLATLCNWLSYSDRAVFKK